MTSKTKLQAKTPLTVYEKENTPTVLSSQQLIHLLQRTPEEHIYKRPAKGGGEWEYVTGTYTKKVLNYVFGFLWSSEIRSIEENYGQVFATVRVTVHKPNGDPLIWKEDVGKKDIIMRKGTQIPLDFGNDRKAAITDGLKRCAAQFGIASDVYGKEEFKEIKLERVPETETQVDDGKEALPSQFHTIAILMGLDEVPEEMQEFTFKQAADKIKELSTNVK